MTAFAASPEYVRTEANRTVVKADPKSGRLVRTSVPVLSVAIEPVQVHARGVDQDSPAAVPVSSQPEDLVSLVNRIAGEMGVEDSLVHSVIRAESNYNPRAVSPKGALGLMQLIPSTARRFGVADVFDPKQNVEGGVRYLKFLLAYYQGDYPKTIAAYNAGEGAVDKYHGIPPFEETQNYVYRVARNLKAARQARVSAPASVSPTVAAAAMAETYNPIHTSIGEDGRVYLKTP